MTSVHCICRRAHRGVHLCSRRVLDVHYPSLYSLYNLSYPDIVVGTTFGDGKAGHIATVSLSFAKEILCFSGLNVHCC